MRKKTLKPILKIPDLSKLDVISEEFLLKEEQRAKNFSRFEISHYWLKYRNMSVKELYSLDFENLSVSEALIVQNIKNMIEKKDFSFLDKLYDRLLGKPKEFREEKVIDDVSFIVDLLPKPETKDEIELLDDTNLDETEN